jgi:hypothetical protein
MALAQVQAALARLYTDEAERAAFLADPQGAACALGLEADDAATLAAIAPQTLRRFANSLKAKSLLDARKMTPLTARVLDGAFAGHFAAAAAGLGPGAGRVEQAAALAGRLSGLAGARAIAPDWVGDLARYEAAFVEAAHARRGARLRLFRYPVGAIAGALHGGAEDAEFGPKATVALWARLPGGRLFHHAWPLTR